MDEKKIIMALFNFKKNQNPLSKGDKKDFAS